MKLWEINLSVAWASPKTEDHRKAIIFIFSSNMLDNYASWERWYISLIPLPTLTSVLDIDTGHNNVKLGKSGQGREMEKIWAIVKKTFISQTHDSCKKYLEIFATRRQGTCYELPIFPFPPNITLSERIWLPGIGDCQAIQQIRVKTPRPPPRCAWFHKHILIHEIQFW